MGADSDTDIDFLNYSEMAEMVAELIADAQLLPYLSGFSAVGAWESHRP
jgi:hypothetical protein